MRARFNIQLLPILICIAIFLSNCFTNKHLANEQYLLSKNTILEDGHKVKNKEIYALLKQKPNKKILGFIPMFFIWNSIGSGINNFIKGSDNFNLINLIMNKEIYIPIIIFLIFVFISIIVKKNFFK